MFIDIHELELHRVEFDEMLGPGTIDFGADAQQVEPLGAKGHAELVEEHHGARGVIKDIRLVGSFSAGLQLSCARCLDPVPQHVEREFDLLYRPQGTDAGQEELSVTDAEAEIGYYVGDGLLLEDVLREQILLAVPMKIVCREDCKGLCPQCGTNLNQSSCSCTRPMDPRWQALEGLRDKLHE
jgi:uncharacterized protein